METIRHSIVIEKSVPQVWAALTEPEAIKAWLMDNDFALAEGHRFQLVMDAKTHSTVDAEVTEIVDQERLSYRWDVKALGLQSLVTFILKDWGGRTELTLIHSGWQESAPSAEALYERFKGGWKGAKLPALKTYVETGSAPESCG